MNITINGRSVQAKPGQTVLEVAQEHGFSIPTLCHHPALPPQGACRMCLVEIGDRGALQPACTYPATEGLVVQTHSPKVVDMRRFILNLLLSDHPQDCMTCESTGACELQDLAYEYGVKEARYKGATHFYPVVDANPFLERDYNKCILCRRCVHACQYINGVEAIGLVWRGFNSKIGTAFDGDLEDSPCEFCGMCVELCPTGALVAKQKERKGRAWEFDQVTTTCTYCGVGCQVKLNVKDNQITHVTSAWEGDANHGWTCVKGRFGWDFVNHPDRLTKPLIKKDGEFVEAEWDEALDLVARKFSEIKDTHGGDALAVLTSAKCTNEENFVVQKFTRAVLGTNNVDHCARL